MKEKTIKLFKLITGIAHKELKEKYKELGDHCALLQFKLENAERDRNVFDSLYDDLLKDSQQFEKDRDYWKKQYNDAIKDRDERLLNKDRVYNDIIQSLERDKSTIYDMMMKTCDKFNAKLDKKEAQRRKAVGEKTKANNKVAKLEEEKVKLLEQIEFLKSHRRAPDLQEVKDYTYGRKRKKCEKTS